MIYMCLLTFMPVQSWYDKNLSSKSPLKFLILDNMIYIDIAHMCVCVCVCVCVCNDASQS